MSQALELVTDQTKIVRELFKDCLKLRVFALLHSLVVISLLNETYNGVQVIFRKDILFD